MVNSAGSSTVKIRNCRLRPTRRSWKSEQRGHRDAPIAGRCGPGGQGEDGLLEARAADLEVGQPAAVGQQGPQGRLGSAVVSVTVPPCRSTAVTAGRSSSRRSAVGGEGDGPAGDPGLDLRGRSRRRRPARRRRPPPGRRRRRPRRGGGWRRRRCARGRPGRASSSRRPRRPSTSMADVGSSSSSSGGAPASASGEQHALALAAGERRPPSRPSSPSIPAVATRSSSGQDGREAAADQVRAPRRPRLAGQAAVLQHRADAAGPDRVVRAPAEHAGPAGRRVQQPQDGVDDGGLAGPVGAEQGHRLAGGDGEVEIVDGERVAVADGQSGDRRGRGRRVTRPAWLRRPAPR